mmetsp:Transcript_1731/g.1191  ORF Transcript_1731/g.1191 Transcript_1731/m.1191 type:complete len:96 (+) Transcript_1731:109-396(+)
MPTAFNVFACAFVCFSTCGLALIFPDISDVLGIAGGIGCVNICFIVPLFIYLGLRHPSKSLWTPRYIVIIAIFSVLSLCGFMSVYVSLEHLLSIK